VRGKNFCDGRQSWSNRLLSRISGEPENFSPTHCFARDAGISPTTVVDRRPLRDLYFAQSEVLCIAIFSADDAVMLPALLHAGATPKRQRLIAHTALSQSGRVETARRRCESGAPQGQTCRKPFPVCSIGENGNEIKKRLAWSSRMGLTADSTL